MLASRVAHASAKGVEAQQFGLPKPSWVYGKLATKFFEPVTPRRPCLVQSSPVLQGKDAHVMIKGMLCQSVAKNLAVYPD
jgi:hypothetical protein